MASPRRRSRRNVLTFLDVPLPTANGQNLLRTVRQSAHRTSGSTDLLAEYLEADIGKRGRLEGRPLFSLYSLNNR